MTVVSNTSPIAGLAAAGHLDLLRQLYGNIRVPEAVKIELAAMDLGRVYPATLPWIAVQSVGSQAVVQSLRAQMHTGEAEAIALALEIGADLLLIDERRARRIASRLGVRCIGLIGALVEAKRKGLVDAVKPVLDAVIQQSGFWVGTGLYRRVLEEVGE